jgi:Uma2 family endonuclease
MTLLGVTAPEFELLCRDNPHRRLELTADGEIIVMPPVGLDSSEKNANIIADLIIWNRKAKLGRVFDSSGGFTLPTGAIRSADAMWISNAKAEVMILEVTFPLLVPDFVIELKSKSDRLPTLQAKMAEYQAAGVTLGWLINPPQQQVEVYQLGQEKEVLQTPDSLAADPLLPGFVLELSTIW